MSKLEENESIFLVKFLFQIEISILFQSEFFFKFFWMLLNILAN